MQEIVKIKKGGETMNCLRVIEASDLPSGRSRRYRNRGINARPRSRRGRIRTA